VTHRYHFQVQKVKGHQAALLSATLTRKAAATVSVGTYSAWESTATLRQLGGARREERGGGVLCRHAHSLFKLFYFSLVILFVSLLPLMLVSKYYQYCVQ